MFDGANCLGEIDLVVLKVDSARLRPTPAQLTHGDEIVGLPRDLRLRVGGGGLRGFSGEPLAQHRRERLAAVHEAKLLQLGRGVREHLDVHRDALVRVGVYALRLAGVNLQCVSCLEMSNA